MKLSRSERFTFSDRDRIDPVPWLVAQGTKPLLEWLRVNLWEHRTGPVYEEDGGDFENHLAKIALKSSVLLTRFRSATATLIAEWREPDPYSALDGLLVLYRTLGVARAEPALRMLLHSRLSVRSPETQRLRRSVLAALVSTGPVQSPKLFFKYLTDPDLAGICFRGLYHNDPQTVDKTFPLVFRALTSPPEDLSALRGILWRALRKDTTPELIEEFFVLALPPLKLPELVTLQSLLTSLHFHLNLESGHVFDLADGGYRLAASLPPLPALLDPNVDLSSFVHIDAIPAPGLTGILALESPTLEDVAASIERLGIHA